MTDESVMPFGVHKGKKLANVPADYMLWLLNNGNVYGELKDYLINNKDVFEAEVKQKKK